MNKKKILIIDDDNRNIFALSAILKTRGFTCIASSSAQEGIDMLNKDNDIALVLMDIMMPDMDGYEAIQKIRSTASIAHVPVFAVTAQAMVGDKEKSIAAGATNYISKPIDVDRLLLLMQDYVN